MLGLIGGFRDRHKAALKESKKLYKRAVKLYDREMYKEAISIASAVIEILANLSEIENPTLYAQAYFLKALCLFRTDETDEALENMAMALKQENASPKVRQTIVKMLKALFDISPDKKYLFDGVNWDGLERPKYQY